MTSGATDLTEREIADLRAALDDEFKARATYRQVVEDFGEVRPFVNIVEAEQRHIDALVRVFHRYGISVPDDPWAEGAPRYSSLADACRDGVKAEMDNAALYDRVLAGTERADVIEVYRNLQRASQEHHLPAFERCVERGAGVGRGPGGSGPEGGRGRGMGGGRGRSRGGRRGLPDGSGS